MHIDASQVEDEHVSIDATSLLESEFGLALLKIGYQIRIDSAKDFVSSAVEKFRFSLGQEVQTIYSRLVDFDRPFKDSREVLSFPSDC